MDHAVVESERATFQAHIHSLQRACFLRLSAALLVAIGINGEGQARRAESALISKHGGAERHLGKR